MRAKVISLAVILALLFGLLPMSGGLSAAPSDQRASFTTPVVVVNTSFLNVRYGPSPSYAVLATVVGGTTLPVLGIAENRDWYQVSTVAGIGWVFGQYVLPRGDFANVPLAEAPLLVEETLYEQIVQGTTVITTTTTTTTVPIPSDETAVDRGFTSQREWGVSVEIAHPLRATASINAANIAELVPDESVIFTVLAASFNEGTNWVQVSVPGFGVGWLEQDKLVFRPFACQGTFTAVIITQSVDLRRGPDGTGVNGTVSVEAGSEVYLLDRVGEIYKVELIDGTVGWVEGTFIEVRDNSEVTIEYCERGGAVSRSLIPGQPQQIVAPGVIPGEQIVVITPAPDQIAPAAPVVAIINTGFLNVRSGPGAQYTVVATLPGGTQLDVLGLAGDGVWYLVQGAFGQGWLNSEFVLFRGDGSRLPIIRDAIGQIEQPVVTASVVGPITLYAAPNLTLGTIGTLQGPLNNVRIVARTENFDWVQLDTTLGFGWVQRDLIIIEGNTGIIPVVSG